MLNNNITLKQFRLILRRNLIRYARDKISKNTSRIIKNKVCSSNDIN